MEGTRKGVGLAGSSCQDERALDAYQGVLGAAFCVGGAETSAPGDSDQGAAPTGKRALDMIANPVIPACPEREGIE